MDVMVMVKNRRKREDIDGSDSEIQLVSFKLGPETFAVNVEQVREIGKVESITRVPKMPNFIEGVMNLRGQITTIIDLRRRFGITGDEGRTSQSRVIVAEIGDIQIGIIVDSVQDVITVPSKSLAPPPKTVTSNVDARFLTGICKQPDNLIMLIDLLSILENEEIGQITDMGKESNGKQWRQENEREKESADS
jgi:purine-binding chemotaxis protein CheW